jgi:glycosyltransferase involved in cell wall biosynthesis
MKLLNNIGCFLGLLFCGDVFCSQLSELPFVIIIPSYNNAAWYKKNIDSVLTQDYHKFRVIYVDDCSNDGMSELVQSYLQEYDVEHRVMYIHNEQHCGAMANFYKAIMTCDDREIICNVDGDDWLFDNQVLKKLNIVYQNENIWLTHGDFIFDGECGGQKGTRSGYYAYSQRVIENSSYRLVAWNASALRTFRAWLFKNICYTDLLYENEFLPATHDMAIMFPMLEMAGGRCAFIDDVLYVYNINQFNDNHVRAQLQRDLDVFIRRKRPYARLKNAGIRSLEEPVYKDEKKINTI